MENRHKEIYEAIYNEDANALCRLIDSPTHTEGRGDSSWIYDAVLLGHYHLIQVLFELGCPVNRHDQVGYGVMQTIGDEGRWQAIPYLYACGQDLDDNINDAAETAMHCASSTNAVKTLRLLFRFGSEADDMLNSFDQYPETCAKSLEVLRIFVAFDPLKHSAFIKEDPLDPNRRFVCPTQSEGYEPFPEDEIAEERYLIYFSWGLLDRLLLENTRLTNLKSSVQRLRINNDTNDE
jgi:hypothetical protein